MTLADLIAQRGAIEPSELVRILTPVCESLRTLAASGTLAEIRAELVEVDAQGLGRLIDPGARSATLPARTQVHALGALMHEALTGSPPPNGPIELVGVRPPLNTLVPACLQGELEDVGQVLAVLKQAGRSGTVDFKKAAVHDTRPSNGGLLKLQEAGERAGQVIGSYQLAHRLGEGGMGEVYLGKHLRLGREVAIKVLRPEFAKDPEIVRRFFQEARVVNEINHPHIVEVIDFAEEAGQAFCVMELLKGSSLETVLRDQGSLDVERTRAIMAQASEALHAAHQAGVVHRDVKPANIFLIERDGRKDFVKVLDFGVARVAKAEGSRTQVGAVLGTPAYMSPEQAQGKIVDGRSDVYSLGAVIYEMLSGRVLSSETFTPPPLVDTARGEPVPGALAELMQQCLEMDPSRRPQSALEVGKRLATATGPALVGDTRTMLAEAGLLAPTRSLLPIIGVSIALTAAIVLGVFLFLGPQLQDVAPVVTAPVPAAVSNKPLVAVTVEPAPVPPPHGVEATPTPAPAPVVKTHGVAGHSRKPPPEPVAVAPAPTPAPAQSPGAEWAPRMNALQKEYDALVARYGEKQLTTLEREVTRQALQDFAGGHYAALDASMKDAENALTAAHHRLDR